jgi:hypothetical protein
MAFVHPEVDELRPRLKEILYDSAVEIRATKAALFLFDGAKRFELVTEFGFRGSIRQSAGFDDMVVDRCGRARSPFYVNGVATERSLSQLLFDSMTDRILIAPIYLRGKLIGFVDMRDKPAKAPFDNDDLKPAQKIADRIAEVFFRTNIFGHHFIALSQFGLAVEEPPPAALAEDSAPPLAAPPIEPSRPAAPSPRTAPVRPVEAHIPRLATLILESRAAAGRLSLPTSETLTESALPSIRDGLCALLHVPGSVAVVLSALGHMGGIQEIVAHAEVSEDARHLIQSRLNVWLSKKGETGGLLATTVTALQPSRPRLRASDIQKVFTAPLNAGSIQGLYLTVCFDGNPDRAAHELLAVLHGHLQALLELAMRREEAVALRRRIATRLLEPDFARYPALRNHCESVSGLASQFARRLALSGAEIDEIVLVAQVHDAGMRLLEYERLYGKADLTADEMNILREHASVGAVLVEPYLGPAVARAVLCHHEWVDGNGYPGQLRADDIPLASRIVQICDAWAAMTDADTYQTRLPRDRALMTIHQAAGSQFDAELVARFPDVVRG